jgi:hypothetical protein
MNHRRRRLAIALILATAAAPLSAQTFSAGNDSWTTPGGGTTQVDLSSYPVQSVLGSGVRSGSPVGMQGSPLNSSSIGKADTLMSRGAISGGNGNLTIIALNLSSTNNITLNDGRVYSLQACLSDTPSSAGTISLTTTSGDGGTFDSSFTVLPKLVFSNVNPPYDRVTIDCAGGGCQPLTLSSSNNSYANTGGPCNFNPGSLGIPNLPTGNVTVNNCNGTHTVSLTGHAGFYPGVAANHSNCTFSVSSSNEVKSAGNSWHKPNPPQDCLPAGQAASGARLKPGLAARICAATVTAAE